MWWDNGNGGGTEKWDAFDFSTRQCDVTWPRVPIFSQMQCTKFSRRLNETESRKNSRIVAKAWFASKEMSHGKSLRRQHYAVESA